MKKNYELTGVSCGGFFAKPKRRFRDVPDGEDGEVKVHPQRAVVTMRKSIYLGQL